MPTATVRSSDPPERPPSFFKVIRYPSAPHLSLPKAFVRTYLPNIPRNPTIVTETGDHSWKVEFVKIGEDYCFAHGWEKLATDAQLCIRDIVVFWLVDPKTFHVSFLGENGCERYLPVNKTNDDHDDDDDVVKDDGGDIVCEGHDDDDVPDENLCFKKVFSKKTFRYYMSLPMNFVKAAGLERKRSIKLKDHEGRIWNMEIMVERYLSTKYSLSEGWVGFHKHHKLSDGDICTFTFNKKEGVLYVTQVVKTKEPIKIEDDWLPNAKPCGGGSGVKVKVECESEPEVEVVKRKRGRPQLKGYGRVRIEEGSGPEMVVEKRKKGMPRVEKPSRAGGVEAVRAEPGTESVFRSKHVVYF